MFRSLNKVKQAWPTGWIDGFVFGGLQRGVTCTPAHPLPLVTPLQGHPLRSFGRPWFAFEYRGCSAVLCLTITIVTLKSQLPKEPLTLSSVS